MQCTSGTIPLLQSKLPGATAHLVLEETWDQIRTQLYVCPAITALLIVVRCRENSDYLLIENHSCK